MIELEQAKECEFQSSSSGIRSFGSQVQVGRWLMAVASLPGSSLWQPAGATYMFGLYMKSALGYDQTTLNLLPFFNNPGGNIGGTVRTNLRRGCAAMDLSIEAIKH